MLCLSILNIVVFHLTLQSSEDMALTIVTLQFNYGGCFVSDPTLRYANGITSVENINIDLS